MTEIPEGTMQKYERLRAWFKEIGAVLVAYSGGTDSTLVLKIAHDVLGDRCIGLTAYSASLPKSELEDAIATAHEIGARHVTIESHELEDPRYRENTPARCYFCKSEVYDRILAYGEGRGHGVVVDGSNADDLDDHRPGLKAARKRGVRSPLQEVGLAKEEVREISRHLGLGTWDKPAAACLSSRIPYGTSVSPELLSRIERAENALRRIGLGQLRVRHHGAIARIEVGPRDFERILEHREEIARALRTIGYTFITLDIEGFRSGSMNTMIERPEKAARDEVAPQ